MGEMWGAPAERWGWPTCAPDISITQLGGMRVFSLGGLRGDNRTYRWPVSARIESTGTIVLYRFDVAMQFNQTKSSGSINTTPIRTHFANN
jgi:hypothetical protein